MSKKTETLNLRVTPELKELLRRAAQAEHRTVSNFVEFLVREHCTRAGVLFSAEPGSSRRSALT